MPSRRAGIGIVFDPVAARAGRVMGVCRRHPGPARSGTQRSDHCRAIRVGVLFVDAVHRARDRFHVVRDLCGPGAWVRPSSCFWSFSSGSLGFCRELRSFDELFRSPRPSSAWVSVSRRRTTWPAGLDRDVRGLDRRGLVQLDFYDTSGRLNDSAAAARNHPFRHPTHSECQVPNHPPAVGVTRATAFPGPCRGGPDGAALGQGVVAPLRARLPSATPCPPPGGTTGWSYWSLAAHLSRDENVVRRVSRDLDLPPHRLARYRGVERRRLRDERGFKYTSVGSRLGIVSRGLAWGASTNGAQSILQLPLQTRRLARSAGAEHGNGGRKRPCFGQRLGNSNEARRYRDQEVDCGPDVREILHGGLGRQQHGWSEVDHVRDR